jgi:hypothetical protein
VSSVQRYFRMTYSDYMRLASAIWSSDDRASRPRTPISSSAVGLDTSVWTADLASQDRLRSTLQELGILVNESASQQVKTFIEGFME